MEILNTLGGILFIIGAGCFAFMSSHINSEVKAGKHIPLPWEKKDEKAQFMETKRTVCSRQLALSDECNVQST